MLCLRLFRPQILQMIIAAPSVEINVSRTSNVGVDNFSISYRYTPPQLF